MKNKLILRMYIILIISVLAVASGVFITVFIQSYNATINDIRYKANGVRDYVLSSLSADDFKNLELGDSVGAEARIRAQDKLNLLLTVGNFKYLYIAVTNESGQIITTLNIQNPNGTQRMHIPTGELQDDLRKSLDENVAVTGRWIQNTDYGYVYNIFWPIMDDDYTPMGVVGMEFDVETTYGSFTSMLLYSAALSVALIIVFSIIAYLSMSKVSEPFYKKLAYTDFLTGLHNRLAYEQRLTSCEQLAAKGVNVTLVMFDVNNLKTINDTLGHKAGDNYIINTTKVITELIKDLGEVYRIGGDEFAAIIVDRKKADIDRFLNTLRREKRHVLNKFQFSCAFGAATYNPDEDDSLGDLAKRADEEMYGEKRRQKERLRGGRRKEGPADDRDWSR